MLQYCGKGYCYPRHGLRKQFLISKLNEKPSVVALIAGLVLLSFSSEAYAQSAPESDAAATEGAAAAKPAEGAATKPAATGPQGAKPAADAAAQAAQKQGVHPPAAREHYNRGVELHRGGFLNKAIAEYKLAIEADANMEPAYSNIGLVYTAQKSWSKALEAFDKALAMKPDRTTSLNGLGTVLYAMKRNDEAMEKWKKAIEIDPKFASAYYNMGNAFETQEKHRDALGCYVKASDINPNMADAYYRIGTLMNKTKHGPQAHVLLNRAVKLAPEAEFARDARKQIEGLEKQFERDGSEMSTATTGDQEPAKPSESKPKAVASGTADSAKDDKKAPGKMFKNPFKKKGDEEKAPGKNVNMFIQPPSSDSDLKPSG